MSRVVIVEDDAVNALLFRRLLERRARLEVTVTESPDELLALARDGGVGLVLMDVSLARSSYAGRPVSGIDLCRLLKGDAACVAIPVLLLTAHAMLGDGDRLLAESGADGYIPKPVTDHDAFVALIRERLERKAA